MDSIPQISRIRQPSTQKRHSSSDTALTASIKIKQSKSISSLLNLKPDHSKTKSTILSDLSFKKFPKFSSSDLLSTERTQLSSHSTVNSQSNELPRIRTTNFISDSLRNKWDVLSMCMNYRNGKDLEPTLNMISTIMKALDILSKEPGKYKEEMELIVTALKSCVFSTRDKIPNYLQDEIYELFTDTVISMDSSIPYFYLYNALLSIYERYRDKVNMQDILIQELENKCIDVERSKDKIIKELADQVQTFQNEIIETRQIKEFYLDKNLTKDTKILKLKNKLQTAYDKMRAMKVALHEDSALINDQQKKLKKHEEMYVKLMTEHVALTQSSNELKQNYENMTSSYSKVLAKLKQSYEKHQDFDAKICELERENYKVSLRAAVAFDDLTPRPNLDHFFEELDMPISKKTTVDKAKILHSSVHNIKESMNNQMPSKNSSRRSVTVTKTRSSLIETRHLVDFISEDSKLIALDITSSSSKHPKDEGLTLEV